MTIIPRALVNHQLRCDVQNCHACGGDHTGMLFVKLPHPYKPWDRFAMCPMAVSNVPAHIPVLMRESEAGPFAEGKE
jgi:hypothetical protein